MTQARSQPIINWRSPAAGQTQHFTVPAGYTLLVKSFNAVNWNASSGITKLYVQLASTSAIVNVAILSLAPNTVGSWSGFIALKPGDQVYVDSTVATMDVIVSGAVLFGAPQFAPVTS